MKHLLNIQQNNGKSVVSARELYDFLEPKTEFSHWCKRMFEYGFTDGVDFTPILTESTGGRPGADFALALNCAKEISMLQRTDRGKEARQYFIDCEKNLLSPANDDEIILRAVNTLQTRVEDYKMRLLQANETIIEQAPIVKYANDVLSSPDLISTTVIAKDLGMSANNLNKILRSRGVLYKQSETWVLYSKYQDKGYTHTKTHSHYDSTGAKRTTIHTYWTQTGRQFIHDLLSHQIKTA